MKKHFIGKTVSGVLCLGIIMQSAAYLPANADNSQSVTLNEVCAKNSTYQSADGNFYDWIELYNSGSQEANISGWGLSDKEDKPYLYTFPKELLSRPAKDLSFSVTVTRLQTTAKSLHSAFPLRVRP